MNEATKKTLSIVIADDIADVRTVLRYQLEDAGGFDIVGEAKNGDEAVDLVVRLTPDLLVLDLAMPRMDGIEVIEKLKRTTPQTKIVVLSNAGRSMIAEAMARGADAYLDKGGSIFEVTSILREVCK